MRDIRYVAVVPALTVVLALAGCGGSSAGNSASVGSGQSNSAPPTSSAAGNAPADKAAATAQIKAAYRKFFSANARTAGNYVEDGAQVGRSFGTLQKIASGAAITAKVKTVTFTSPTQADVGYTLAVGGHVVLGATTPAPGQAVLVNGKWLVAKATFCQLAQLGVGAGKSVPGC